MNIHLQDYQKTVIAALAVLFVGLILCQVSGITTYDKDNRVLNTDNPTPQPSAAPTAPQNNTTAKPTPKPTPKTNTTQYVIYCFVMPNCEYCEQLEPTLTAYDAAHANVRVVYYNTWTDAQLAAQYGVKVTPTTFLFREGSSTPIKTWISVFDVNEITPYLK